MGRSPATGRALSPPAARPRALQPEHSPARELHSGGGGGGVQLDLAGIRALKEQMQADLDAFAGGGGGGSGQRPEPQRTFPQPASAPVCFTKVLLHSTFVLLHSVLVSMHV